MYKAQISRTISSLACIMIPSKLGMHMLLDFVCIDWLQSKSVEDWLEKKILYWSESYIWKRKVIVVNRFFVRIDWFQHQSLDLEPYICKRKLFSFPKIFFFPSKILSLLYFSSFSPSACKNLSHSPKTFLLFQKSFLFIFINNFGSLDSFLMTHERENVKKMGDMR